MSRLPEEWVGQWVVRRTKQGSTTLQHLVQSVREDRVITNCGRELYLDGSNGQLAAVTPATVLQCMRCL